MREIALRDADAADFAAVVALNAAEVRHTSPMDEARLRQLHGLANYHKVATVDGAVAAFLLAMEDGCGHANENFEWFAACHDAFLYVDRIVVGGDYRRLRLGMLLYQDLFDYARSNGIATIACEYNVVPPNEPSRLFHDKFGFHQVGSQWLGNGSKQVSLQVAKA
ncbi:GNAT family N-acetyltransferase [Pseudoxanthomonas yeongjuensis]|uniref:GNAT family N-acetyltransferase n=1 Tax=Pseudoxanthomonas yeongjuensis TaxID=377616 RepID=UPI0013909869|nr:GNAT family N-acetyltransferase [Pseudoxanthomonas yeongjuensis]KAF1718569.1 GNAT family N-acetyltransferase [Pseudoxanthomonas yeongjuensis]